MLTHEELRERALTMPAVRAAISPLDIILEDFDHRPPRGTARRLATGCPRVTDDAWLVRLLGTSPGYWLRLAGACKTTHSD